MTKAILVFRDDLLIERTKRYFAEYQPHYQKVIDEFSDLQIGEISNKDDLQTAIMNPQNFLRGAMLKTLEGAQIGFGGLRLDTEKMIELIDEKQLSEFTKAANSAKPMIGEFVEVGDVRNGKVYLSDDHLEKFIERNSVYASTPKELKTLESMNRIRDAVQQLFDDGIFPYSTWQLNLNQLLQKSENEKEFKISVDFFTSNSK